LKKYIVLAGRLQFLANCPEICPSTNYSVYSGSAVSITVQRVGGSDGDTIVSFKTQDDMGSAKANLDYIPAHGVLSWMDGDSSDRSIVIQTIPTRNALVETIVTLSVSLFAPVGMAIISPAYASNTFVDIISTLSGNYFSNIAVCIKK